MPRTLLLVAIGTASCLNMSALSASAQSDDPYYPWRKDYWTPHNENGIGVEATPAPTWEGATVVTEGSSFGVWCSKHLNALGYELTFDQTLLSSDPAKYTVATVSAGGHLFNLPIVQEYEQYQIPGVPNEAHWNGQEEFLNRIARSRVVELVSVSDANGEETVHLGSVIQTLGCGAGLERVVALCGKGEKVESEFCDRVFCPGNIPILEHFKQLVDAEPDETFFRPRSEIKINAEDAQELLGDDGVYGFAEGMCFAPNGIMSQ